LVLFDAPTRPATTEPAAMIPTAQGPPKKSIAPLPACFKPVNAEAPTPLIVPAMLVTAAVELRPMDVNTPPAQSQPLPASRAARLATRPISRWFCENSFKGKDALTYELPIFCSVVLVE